MSRFITAGFFATISIAGVACTAAEAEPEPGEQTLEQALAAGEAIISGFVADGTGCATLGEPVVDGDSATFFLTDYIAERDGRGLARATCDLAVVVDLPSGLTVSLDNAIYHGFADGSNARTTFYREYFFAGQFIGDRRFTVQQYDADGDVTTLQDDSDDYVTEFGEFTALDQVLSVGATECGETVVWRTNTALSVRNFQNNSFSMAAIDTVDVENQFFITLELDLVPCT